MNTSYLNAVDEHRRQTGKKYKEREGFQDLLVECLKEWEPGISHRSEVLKKEDRIEWFCRLCPDLCNFSPHEFIEAMQMPKPQRAIPRAVPEPVWIPEYVYGNPDLFNPDGTEKQSEGFYLACVLDRVTTLDVTFPLAKQKSWWGHAIADLARALALPDVEVRKLIARMFNAHLSQGGGVKAIAFRRAWDRVLSALLSLNVWQGAAIECVPRFKFFPHACSGVRGSQPARAPVLRSGVSGDLALVALREGVQIDLVGGYNAYDNGGGGTHTLIVGRNGLSVGRVCPHRQSPFEIRYNGCTIGWAPASSIRAKRPSA
jgi:hypothetical protein